TCSSARSSRSSSCSPSCWNSARGSRERQLLPRLTRPSRRLSLRRWPNDRATGSLDRATGWGRIVRRPRSPPVDQWEPGMTSHLVLASSVSWFTGWKFTGNYTTVDLIAASTNALNGALLARRPDHYKNFTAIGILGMALLGGLGGGITRDVLLGNVPSAL